MAKRPDPTNLLYLPAKSRVRLLKKGTKIAPKSDRKFDENVVKILIDFWMILGGLWGPFWLHFGIKIASKNRSKTGRLRDQGMILVNFSQSHSLDNKRCEGDFPSIVQPIFTPFCSSSCLHFGLNWVPFSIHFGIILAPFWLHFGSILVSFWLHFSSICLPGGVPGTGSRNVHEMSRFWRPPGLPFGRHFQ